MRMVYHKRAQNILTLKSRSVNELGDQAEDLPRKSHQLQDRYHTGRGGCFSPPCGGVLK